MTENVAQNNTSGANAYVFFCSRNDQGGVVGIAWVGGTCYPSGFGKFKSSVVEYLSNDAVTANVSYY